MGSNGAPMGSNGGEMENIIYVILIYFKVIFMETYLNNKFKSFL